MKLNKESCSKEKNMTIPQLRAINKLVLHPGEVFIAAGGFEERVFRFPDMLELCEGLQNNAFVLEYLPDDSRNKCPKLCSMLRDKGLDITCLPYNRHAPEGFDIQLKNKLQQFSAQQICLDISGMSRLAIMVIMDVACELSLSLRIVYAEAQTYAPSQEDFENAKASGEQHLPTSFIHTGVHDVLHVGRLSSIRMQNHATLLIAFDSFNEGLCQVLVNGVSPSNFILINGRPPRDELAWREEATLYVHHRLRKEWSVGNDNRPEETTSTLFYDETYKLLVSLYWEFSATHRIILAPTGSKMQTIGCYLLRAVHNDIHVEYPAVQGFFSDKYSTGVRECWELDFGTFQDFIDMLRQEEISENLGLPKEFVDAEV